MAATWWHQTTRQVLDAVFPPKCAGCSVRGFWLCPACLRRVERLDAPVCDSCHSEVAPPFNAHGCRRTSPLAAVCATGVYAGPLREAIHALKYQGRHGIAATLAALLTPALAPLIGEGDLLVPVPLHPTRQRERGYNQAAVLAAEIAHLLPRVAVEDALRRTRPTPQQTRMANAAQRQANVRGAFEASSSSVAGARVWLLDDVYTTGATLRAGAQALRRAGAREVNGAVIARATGE